QGLAGLGRGARLGIQKPHVSACLGRHPGDAASHGARADQPDTTKKRLLMCVLFGLSTLATMTQCFNLLRGKSDVRQIWTACILLSTAMGSSAVTLGRHGGAALIGQPLDLQIPVMLSPGEDIATQCLQAEVLYGDVPVGPNFISVTP